MVVGYSPVRLPLTRIGGKDTVHLDSVQKAFSSVLQCDLESFVFRTISAGVDGSLSVFFVFIIDVRANSGRLPRGVL